MNNNEESSVEEEGNQTVLNKKCHLLKEANEKMMIVKPLIELGIVLSKQNQKPESAEPTVRKRQNVTGNGTHSQTNSEYTEDQLNHVKRIKKCKNYYEILEISKDATYSYIKKAYKRLALQLHPDENKAPGAAKAFNVISNAVTILIDPEKRKQYDMYSSAEERMQNVHTNSKQTNRYILLLQILSILLICSLSYILYMKSTSFTYDKTYNESTNKRTNSTELDYSLYKNKIYSLARKTKYISGKYTVTYYVKENFHCKDEDSLKAFEYFLTEKYVENLKQECIKQHTFKQKIIERKMKSNNLGDIDMYMKSINFTMPYCQRYEEMTGHSVFLRKIDRAVVLDEDSFYN